MSDVNHPVYVSMSRVKRDPSMQPRVAVCMELAAEYAEAYRSHQKMPPVIVYGDMAKGPLWLADGWHRMAAMDILFAPEVNAEVRPGGRMDALKHALGANAGHGARRTNADKRRCVEIALREFPNLASREIGKMCAVSHTFVDNLRGQVATVANSTTAPDASADSAGAPLREEKRVGADGKLYPAAKAKQAEEKSRECSMCREMKPAAYFAVDGPTGQEACKTCLIEVEMERLKSATMPDDDEGVEEPKPSKPGKKPDAWRDEFGELRDFPAEALNLARTNNLPGLRKLLQVIEAGIASMMTEAEMEPLCGQVSPGSYVGFGLVQRRDFDKAAAKMRKDGFFAQAMDMLHLVSFAFDVQALVLNKSTPVAREDFGGAGSKAEEFAREKAAAPAEALPASAVRDDDLEAVRHARAALRILELVTEETPGRAEAVKLVFEWVRRNM